MAVEYAAPFVGTTIATSQQFRDRNRCLGPDGIDADVTTSVGVVTDGGGGTSINVSNYSALIQGSRYELTAGPLNLAVAANGGGSNRYDIVCATYDATHNPGIYTRIVQGTPGAGLPALTHSLSGVYDFPIAHYQKTPAGAITGIVQRRRYLDPNGLGVMTPDQQPVDWVYPTAAARRGQRVRYWPNGQIWEYDGSTWTPTEWFIRRDANATARTNNTLADDGVLRIPSLSVNSTFEFYGVLHYAAHSSGDLALGWTNLAGATVEWTTHGPSQTIAGQEGSVWFGPFGIGNVPILGGATTNNTTPQSVIIMGTINTGATAGDMNLRWAQGTTFATGTIMLKESWIKAKRVRSA